MKEEREEGEEREEEREEVEDEGEEVMVKRPTIGMKADHYHLAMISVAISAQS